MECVSAPARAPLALPLYSLLILLSFAPWASHAMTSETTLTTPTSAASDTATSFSGLACTFETECAWNWTRPSETLAGFEVVTYEEVKRRAQREPPHTFAGPERVPEDAAADDHFLFLSLRPKVHYTNNMTQFWSPWFNESGESCRLEAAFLIHKFRDVQEPFKILIQNSENIAWMELDSLLQDDADQGDSSLGSKWQTTKFWVGRIPYRFRLIIEVVVSHMRPSYVAIDTLRLVDCFPDAGPAGGECTGVRCDTDSRCISRDYVCDIAKDCLKGEDEAFCVDGVPEGARCDFEGESSCGWRNLDRDGMDWRLHQGATDKDHTGPSVDHTFKNKTGYYMLNELPVTGDMGDEGILASPIFPPPPCYHRNPSSPYFESCKLRMYLHKLAKGAAGAIAIEVVDPQRPDAVRHVIEQIGGNKGSHWFRFIDLIPTTIDFRYQIRVINIRGVRSTGDLGLDDVSLSLECFGIGVPENETKKCPPPPPTPIGINMCAAALNDSENNRFVDRIRAVTFREARDAGASFISRSWVALRLGRSEDFVKRNWNKSLDDCEAKFAGGRPEVLSQESKDIVIEGPCCRKKSCTQLSQEIQQHRGKTRSREVIRLFRQRQGLKAWHEIPKPRKTQLNIEDRLWFVDFLREWDEGSFLHLAVSDEFFVYVTRRPNFQNDRIWSLTPDDIPDEERHRELIKRPDCVGVFVLFTARRMMWVKKPRGQSWDGDYFREKILTERVIPFLQDPQNTLNVTQVTFLHDKAPCMKALRTQNLLKDNNIEFFGNDEWPGNSPDLNVCENVGSILKDEVEKRMLSEPLATRFSRTKMEEHIDAVLRGMEFNTELFESLLSSYPARLQAVRDANGGNTDY